MTAPNGDEFPDFDSIFSGQFFADASSPANGEPEDVVYEYPVVSDDDLADLREKLTGSREVSKPVIESDKTLAPEPIDIDFEAQVLLSQVEAELNAVEVEYADETAQLEAIEAEEAELRKQMDMLRERKAKYANRRGEYNRRVRDLRRQADIHQQDIDLELQRRRRIVELESEKSAFDQRTLNALWRVGEMPAMKHQYEGAYFAAAARRALVADEMGLGKTIESIMMMDMLGVKRLLIICPGDVMSGFYNAIARWAPHRAPIVIGRQPKAMQQTILEASEHMEFCTFIVNYESWARNKTLIKWLVNAKFDGIICDEAHVMKSGSNVSTYMGVADIMKAKTTCNTCGYFKPYGSSGANYCTRCESQPYLESGIEYALMMTGTPILNSPEEIYPLLNLLYPEMFFSRSTYLNNFCSYDSYAQKYTWRAGGEKALAQKIGGFYIRRTMTDAGITLPPQTPYVHEIEITQEEYPLQAALLEMLRNDASVSIHDGSHVTVNDVLSLITRQRQATVWPGDIWMRRVVIDPDTGMPQMDWDNGGPLFEKVFVGQDYKESAKLDKAIELAKEFTAMGKRWVLFSQFKGAIKEFVRRYGDGCVEYDGDTPQRIQEEVKTNFDRSYGEVAKWEGIAAQYKKGGIGLTLTSATAMIILDEEWNEGKILQAYGRINRIGQTEETTVHILQHTGPGFSIDAWLSKLIERKRRIVGGFNDANKDVITIDDWKSAFGK